MYGPFICIHTTCTEAGFVPIDDVSGKHGTMYIGISHVEPTSSAIHVSTASHIWRTETDYSYIELVKIRIKYDYT